MLVPGAFVHLDLDESAAAHKRLRIYSAGAWHNAALAAACHALKRALPWVLWPLYAYPTGSAYVSWIAPHSPLHAHLAEGDAVVALDSCPVTLPSPLSHARAGADGWGGCLRDVARVGLVRTAPEAADSRELGEGLGDGGYLRGYCVDGSVWRDALERDLAVGGARGSEDCCGHLSIPSRSSQGVGVGQAPEASSRAAAESGSASSPLLAAQTPSPSQEEMERQATLEAIQADRGARYVTHPEPARFVLLTCNRMSFRVPCCSFLV